jgi:hypothetical protein
MGEDGKVNIISLNQALASDMRAREHGFRELLGLCGFGFDGVTNAGVFKLELDRFNCV